MNGRSEFECEDAFRRMGQVFNANTPENHPIVFKTIEEYKAGMSILAISARMFPAVTIYAFQVMSNHIHLVVGGDVSGIQEFFTFFVRRLDKYFEETVDLSGFMLKLFPVSDLAYFRNAVAYVNRNGFVVNNDVTPFSYPWGSSGYFFQPVAVRYSRLSGKGIGVVMLRDLMHTRKCDEMKTLNLVDGSVCPLEFCDVKTAELAFRDAKQYFYCISRNVESYSEIAKSIGESIFYSDNNLYGAASKLAKEYYGSFNIRSLSADAKIEIAKRLHYDYNAGDKQLQRLLGIDAFVLKALF